MKNLIIYFIIFSSILFSQGQLFVGTRPLGMGGAFVAVADDGTFSVKLITLEDTNGNGIPNYLDVNDTGTLDN